MTDARARLEVAREIWSEGRISLEPSRVSRPVFWIPRPGGRVVSFYGLGQSLAFAPFDAVGCAISATTGAPAGVREFVRWLPVGLGLLPLVGFLWWAVLAAVLRELGFAEGLAAGAAGAALLATLAFFYIGNEQEESLVGCLLALALLFALRSKKAPGPAAAAAAGLFAGLALLTRLDSAFGFLPVGLLLAEGSLRDARGRRKAAAAAAAFAVPAAVVLLYNRARFGSPFETGYGLSGLSGLWRIDRRCAGTFLALLFGPGKGWFVMSPLCLAALFGWRAFRRRSPALAAGSAAGFILAAAFDSAFQGNSDGPWSWGPRYLAYFATFWAIPLALAIEASGKSRLRRGALLTSLALSAGIQVASVWITQNLEYVQLRRRGIRQWSVLLTSAREGQLRARISNVARWASGPAPSASAALPPNEWMPAGTDAEKEAFIESRYIPNFWGPSFAKLLRGRRGSIVLAVWAADLVAAIALLGIGARGFRCADS